MSIKKWVDENLKMRKQRDEVIKKHYMPLTKKGKEIMGAMDKEYGEKKGKEVFYASKNKGTIKGVEGAKGKALKKLKK